MSKDKLPQSPHATPRLTHQKPIATAFGIGFLLITPHGHAGAEAGPAWSASVGVIVNSSQISSVKIFLKIT
jgi:hypothetical protein